MTPATAERRRLADTFLEVGPYASTLCYPWSARDLAAHLVLRERRPDAAAGIIVPRLAGYTEKVQRQLAAGDWEQLVEQVREGPPLWAPTRVGAIDRLANTAEFFIHHEDVLRAQPDWTVRELDPELAAGLADALKHVKIYLRKAPCGVVLEPTDGHPSVVAKDADPSVTVRGAVGELLLFAHGRQTHAVVEYDGADADVELLQTAKFGL